MTYNANSLQVFDFNESAVCVIMLDGEPCFVGKDICNYFGDKNYKRSLSRLDEDERGVREVYPPGGIQKMNVVCIIYYLILSQPKLAAFQKNI